MILKRKHKRKGFDGGLCVLTILSEPASKANSRRIVKIHGRIASIKSKKALRYSKNFKLQCPIWGELWEDDLCIAMRIYYSSLRPDLDESLILDLLQKRIYKNDRQVKIKYIEHGLDRTNPRSIIVIGPIEDRENVMRTLHANVEREEEECSKGK